MTLTVVGGDGKPTGYEISNSLRFNDDDSAKLGITFGSGGNRKTYTISFWVKRGRITAQKNIFGTASEGDTLYFDGGDRLRFFQNGSASSYLGTNRLFRDPSAWYHIVVAVDTNQSTSTNRVKLYINGSQYTWDASTTYPAEDYEGDFNHTADEHMIGNGHHGNYFDGYISEFYFIDGTQYAASDFGETNDNGVWIPKAFTGTFGSNGFLCEFKQTGTSANASGMGADTSGNGNHLTPTNLNAYDVTTDTPSNNFCTMNPLMSFAGASDGIDAFSEGNTVVDSNNDTSAAGSTFGVKNGKWYYEAKLTTGNQSSTNFSTGWCQVDYEGQKGTGNGVGFMTGEDNASMDVGGNIIWNNSGNGNQATFGNRSTNDIFQVALDLDNHKMWFGVNGTWSNGSASQSTTFNASSSDFSSIFDTTGVHYMPAFAQGSTGQTVLAYNFGNPSYANSSSESDDNGYGDFEYPVPSGFYSLCTKNLAEFG